MISEYYNDFLRDEVILCDRSTKTVERYKYFYKLLVDFIGEVPASSITIESTRRWRELLYTYQKPDTVRGYIGCLRAFLKYCVRKGVSFDFDVEDIKLPKREKRMLDIPTDLEVREFIDLIGEPRRGYNNINRLRNIAIAELIYSSGMRVGEVCALNRNSIKNRQATIVGKSSEPRICFIDTQTERAITEYLQARTDNNPALFISYQTERRITSGNVRNVFKHACVRSDGRFENIHPHTLRHAFATKLLERRVDLRYIGDLMGHKDLNTTRMYTHYSNPKLKEIYDQAHRGI